MRLYFCPFFKDQGKCIQTVSQQSPVQYDLLAFDYKILQHNPRSEVAGATSMGDVVHGCIPTLKVYEHSKPLEISHPFS